MANDLRKRAELRLRKGPEETGKRPGGDLRELRPGGALPVEGAGRRSLCPGRSRGGGLAAVILRRCCAGDDQPEGEDRDKQG